MSFRVFALAGLLVSAAVFAADGDPDPGFAGGGIATRTVTSPFYVASADAALDAAGGILVASTEGVSNGSRATKFVVARFNADGSVDGSYGTSGVAAIDLGDGTARTA